MSQQPAEQLNRAHPSTDDAFAGANEGEEAAVRPGRHGMQEPASGAGEEQLPSSATLSPDTAGPSSAEAAQADSSSAEYHATHDEWEAETAPNDWTVTEGQRAVSTDEDLLQQPAEEAVQHQPGVFAQTAIHCMTPALFATTYFCRRLSITTQRE